MTQAAQSSQPLPAAETEVSWWRGAVIYQVYPRSLLDSNGDGIGDLPGVRAKLPYIADLGVDAVWISPFFKSPMKDFGYDVSDFRAIDPIFGTLADFDAVIDEAHRLGLKVMIDLVLSHTSDQHAWFAASRERREDKDDWYVWADGTGDGEVPNNWLSVFGGSAWQWDEARGQYYLHNFLSSQPDLNFHCPAVRAQMLAELKFWLERGVDGFRLDALNYCFHDAQLRDNPLKPEAERRGRGFSPDNPYAWQYHQFDNTRPENLGLLEDIRELLDRYPGSVSLGEINSDDSAATIAEYTNGGNRLHMGYSFELLSDESSAAYIRATVSELEQGLAEGWPCWALSNHDVTRVLSRWGGDNPPPQLAKLLTMLAGSLRGTICTYQGEELGLTEAEIQQHQLQDPFGINFWPSFKGRDGCRTPMPWQPDGATAGFSEGTPWLPIPDEHRAQSVAIQSADPDSVLNHYKRFLAWRKRQPALCWGDIEFIECPGEVLGFVRSHAEQRLVALFNLSDQPSTVELPSHWSIKALFQDQVPGPTVTGPIELAGHSAWFGQLPIGTVAPSSTASSNTSS